MEIFENNNLTKFTIYITRENDRWDTIAYRFYGNSLLYQLLIEANPSIDIKPVLKSGLKIKVPHILEIDQNSEIDLPPWKRGYING